ncbi:MAG: Gldg family protein [Gemmatimonadales bacterium]|nr:Gldg family protein [Gemmatimonadales bacterium]MDQ3426710.1 Gldg family protein [Gemmatimonadota bacterium]
MTRLWTVARRELKALFDLPAGYVLLVVFLAINGFVFFRQAYLSDTASLRPMLDLLPWVFLIFVPAVTMRTLAEDIRGGQLEVVLSQPLSELELLLGKYLGSVLFLWIALALTLAIPLGLATAADLHWGIIAAQYAGAGLLAAGLAGVGIWASSLTRSQITAFIMATGIMFLLILVGLDPLLVGLPPTLAAVAARLGVLSHFESFGRGVIDLRDVIYFLSLAGVFLALAYGALQERKLAPGGGARRRLRLGVGIATASLIVVNLLGTYIGGRLDLSPGNAYTLSPATRRIVSGVDDLVTIKVFTSPELPTEVALLKRDVDDLLRDLRSAGGGKVRILERNPTDDESALQEAQSLGIQPVQFNVIGRSELQVKQGYLGLAIQHGGETEAIPFVQRTDDLEYNLVSAIRNLTRDQKPVVGMVSSTRGAGATFQEMERQLARSYEVRNLDLADSTQPGPDVTTLVLAGAPDSLPAAQLSRLQAFFGRGGSALVLAAGMEIDQRAPTAQPRPVAWNALLKQFGLAIRSDMAYDLLANEVIPLPTDFGRVLQVYPFFIRAQSTRLSPINQELGTVVLTWASTIDTTGAAKGSITPLLVSSRATGSFTGPTTIAPTQDFPQTGLEPRLLAAVASSGKQRVAVVGSVEFATDRFVQTAQENLSFALNAVDWLAQDEALIAIRSKDRRPPSLLFESDVERDAVKYANVFGVPLAVALFGLVRLLRRRRRTREPYRPLVAASESAA